MSLFRTAARPAILAVAVVCAVAVVSGCGGSTTPSSGPGTSSATPTEVIDQALAAKNRTPDPGAVGIALTNISVTKLDRVDRVTFQFTGNAIPGWAVHFVTPPIVNGPKTVFPINGKGVLEVLMREAANPFGSGAPPYQGPPTVSDPSATSITEVGYASAEHGVTQAFIGLTVPQPGFAVSSALNPPRVFVDIDR